LGRCDNEVDDPLNRLNSTSDTPSPVAAAPLRATGCPGLRRIVQAKDGGICRIKLPCGQLTSAQARTVADVALRCTADVIEATNRSNLQLRGVNITQASVLTDALIAAGLGSPDDGSDDVRNVMVSPAAGIDPAQLTDTTPLAMQLLSLLQRAPRFHALSAKFAVQIDGGESMAMLQHSHDIWLSAMQRNEQQRMPLFVFGLAGCPPVWGSSRPPAMAAVAADYVQDLIAAIMQVFLDHASLEQTRMRHLLQQMTKAEFMQQLHQRVKFPLIENDDIKNWRRSPPSKFTHIGTFKQNDARHVAVGAAPVLGRLNATQLRSVADIADSCGDGTMRFTPWQSVLLPNIRKKKANAVQQQLHRLGFAISSSNPLAHLIACTGSAGCVKGLADTKADARVLANNLHYVSNLPDVHLTGCKRSCAAAHIAPYTLLAVKPGVYDFYQRVDSKPGFGTLLAPEISVDAASHYLSNASRPDNHQ
jgi:precorrin-3B synthase